jgi:hypothetical protein
MLQVGSGTMLQAGSPGVDSASNGNKYPESSWGVKGGRRVRADNLTAICEPIV